MTLTFRKGNRADTEDFIRFLAEIKAAMPQQEWFYLDPPELVREMMGDGTMELWMAMEEDRLAAVFDIVHPGLHPCNYGYDLALSEEELLQVINIDNAAVHPDYRGLGLQRKMAQMVEQELSRKGKRILLCTVHPDNRFSLNNMLQQGYVIAKRVGKYGSERYVLRKDIF